LRERHWSEGVVEWMVWLSGLVPFGVAEEILQQVGRVGVSDSSLWRRVQEVGEKFKEQMEEERIRANVLEGRWGGPVERVEPKGRMGVAMDGCMIHIREEGWKELKVGCVFEVETGWVVDRETGERVEVGRAVANSYVAHLGGPEVLGQMVWAEAKRRGWEGAVETEVVGDGAPWIWNLAADYFYDSHQVVDWYHATEHLAEAARLLKGEGTQARTIWFNQWKKRLFQGDALQLALALQAAAAKQPEIAEALEREAGYFYNNHRRMNYQEMREERWVIGSGMVESGGKQFKARLAGSGMRWSRPGAERLIPIRAAIMSGRFTELWRLARNSPPN